MAHKFKPTSDGHKSNSYEREVGYKHPNVFWSKDPEGCLYKAVLGCAMEQHQGGTDTVFDRIFGGHKVVADILRRYCPSVDEWYQEKRGELLPAAQRDYIIYHRYHKQYYGNDLPKGMRGVISKENWKHDPKLRPYIYLAQEIVCGGKVVSREYIQQKLNEIHPAPKGLF